MCTDRQMNLLYTYNGILLSLKKEENPTICNNIVGPEDMLGEITHSQKDKYYMMPLL